MERSELEAKYTQMVKDLFKPGTDILASLSPEKCVLLHAAIGISGEAGELLDAIKKHVMYNKKLDLENVIEELGDLEFYLEAIRQVIHVTREELLEGNCDKLLNKDKGRYSTGTYSDTQAQQRADKQ